MDNLNGAAFIDGPRYTGNPGPEEIRLILEIADTTLHLDHKVKAALYASASIAEYWIVDIPAERMIVHREARAGSYSDLRTYGFQDPVAPLSAPDSAISKARLRVDGFAAV